MNPVNRREFLKYAGGGMIALVVGSKLGWFLDSTPYAAAATRTISLRITDAIKEMTTHETGLLADGTRVGPGNSAECYFWIYKSTNPDLPAEVPGPYIIAAKGDTVQISVTNALDEPHAFYIPGIIDSGPIAPGGTFNGTFTANTAGAFLYYDNLNGPVNRMMGLHGALCVVPTTPAAGHKLTPYDNPTANVQRIYDDFGGTAHWPGLAWEQGDLATNVPPFRMYVWLTHQASPKLFAEVGNAAPGTGVRIPANFKDAFLRDPFTPHAYHTDNPGGNRIPQYFTINGQSGFFSHFGSYTTPMGRVGEPCIVRILNAGLWTHSMHLHANHFYVTSVNGVVQANPIWVDVYNIHPMDQVDYTIPFMRPPDFPNQRGIGYPDTPLLTEKGQPVYPCVEEFNVHLPGTGEVVAKNRFGTSVDCHQRQSPLCYPMHDHSEPSQTSQGGNYNTGLISGIYFVGDRNIPGHMDFPMDEDFRMAYGNHRGFEFGASPAAPAIGH